MTRTPPEASSVPTGGYPSARDLPFFVQKEVELRAAKSLAFVRPEVRLDLEAIEQQLSRLTKTVDDFYRLLPDSGWIFIGRYSTDRFAILTGTGDREQLEAELVSWFSRPENLGWLVTYASAIQEMRPRAHLLALARSDAIAGRYYSAVQLLLSVMDGYVSDLDRGNRKGLHARDPDSMVAWNSVVGHHGGLSAALRIYKKPFGSFEASEVTNLYRHGIVHGMVTRYDNAIVAAKAWNMLAALVEWTQSKSAATNATQPKPTLRETIANVSRSQTAINALSNWTVRSWPDSTDLPIDLTSDPLALAVADIYDGWRDGKWGRVAGRLLEFPIRPSSSGFAGEVRARFQRKLLQRWSLISIELVSPQSADVETEISVDHETVTSKSKWFYVDPSGKFLNEFEPGGVWKTIHTNLDELIAPA